MGLLDGTTQRDYYQGNDYGSYQFVSLEDIINQFIVIYTGEEKVISKAKRTDVAFHAQRALAELSFDTFKSVKTQEISLPPSLTMTLPHDYVNYTRLLYSDSAGIKHPIYPTKHTQNPLKIQQEDDGSYLFSGDEQQLLINGYLEQSLSTGWSQTSTQTQYYYRGKDIIEIDGGRLAFTSFPQLWGSTGLSLGRSYAVWQAIDTTNIAHLSISAVGERAAAAYQGTASAGAISGDPIITFGIASVEPSVSLTNPIHSVTPSPNNESIYNLNTSNGGPSYIKWDGADTAATASEKSQDLIDVSNYDTVYAIVTSNTEWSGGTTGFMNYTKPNGTIASNGTYGTSDGVTSGNSTINYIDNMQVGGVILEDSLKIGESTTWSNYKSGSTSESEDAYDDNSYADNLGGRYGLDTSIAQSNGSFYIDELRGLIHFSSNLSGSTIVLDYISDSLGTDGEMRVHKFAEEAMYKWISHAVLSTRINTPEYVIARAKKEKFAATRQAKLRLSNIKLEEITQILRGKSKWIKH